VGAFSLYQIEASSSRAQGETGRGIWVARAAGRRECSKSEACSREREIICLPTLADSRCAPVAVGGALVGNGLLHGMNTRAKIGIICRQQ
jgi:hypothetical protein